MKVAITGATGFVGSRLVAKLSEQGHAVVVLTRSRPTAENLFPRAAFATVELVEYTPLKTGAWQGAIAGCDGVVNLAGEPIAEGRWTESRKQRILHSRQVGTERIVEAIAQADPKPSVLVNASAIGYYGTSETAEFTENSPAGADFLAQVCQAWEGAAQPVKAHDVRLVILRLGIVLGDGGAIARMIPPFKAFAGGPIGSGRQWFSWIHREDVVNMIIESLMNPERVGVYNATAPQPLRMADFCKTLGKVMGRPSWLPVPSFVIEALLGDGAIVVLEGQQVLPTAWQAAGFAYQYPDAESAIAAVLSH